MAILYVNNVKRSRMPLTGDDGSNSPQVTASSDHAQVTSIEVNVVHDLSSSDVNLDGVIDLDDWVGIPDGASIVGNQERNSTGTNLDTLHLAELVLGFIISNTVDSVTTLNIIDQTEVLVGLLNGDNIHESSRVVGVSADLAVDLDEALHHNFLDFSAIECVLQAPMAAPPDQYGGLLSD